METITISRAEYERLTTQVAALQQENNWLIEQIRLARKWYQLARRTGFEIVNIIDPSAAVSPHAKLGEGVFIGKNAVVNAYARIGNMVIVNTGSIVEHADVLEDFVHIAPGCTLSGGVRVCRGAHVGAGSVVRQDIVIGAESLIGIGSVVVRDIAPRMVAYGNPCKEQHPLEI